MAKIRFTGVPFLGVVCVNKWLAAASLREHYRWSGVVSKGIVDALRVAKSTLTRLRSRLWQLREAHGLTQEAFAERSGISYKYYQAVEAGRKRELRLSTLERLARAYGSEVWQLLAPDAPRSMLAAKRLPPRRAARTR